MDAVLTFGHDDMTELKYDQKGFFLNMAGYY
jgi:hypothetical protein